MTVNIYSINNVFWMVIYLFVHNWENWIIIIIMYYYYFIIINNNNKKKKKKKKQIEFNKNNNKDFLKNVLIADVLSVL